MSAARARFLNRYHQQLTDELTSLESELGSLVAPHDAQIRECLDRIEQRALAVTAEGRRRANVELLDEAIIAIYTVALQFDVGDGDRDPARDSQSASERLAGAIEMLRRLDL